MRLSRTAWHWILAKEFRELLASRSWWVMLVLTGPLVGVSFINAVRIYAEASGLGGTSVGVGEAFSPLVGIWSPTFGAYEIIAVFLLPFVAIRMVSADRQSGAMKLEMQQSIQPFGRLAAKLMILGAGWIVVFIAGAIAAVLWVHYGGSIYMPEVLSVIFGHSLNVALTIAFGFAVAAIVEHPSTAAILTFGFTIGTWALDFVAAVHGGFWEQIAAYTPTAMVAQFQHGLVRFDVVVIAIVFIASWIALASIWIRLGRTIRQRILESSILAALAAVALIGAANITASRDFSENRQNSFAEADEALLKQIKSPMRIEAHLAPEDPRRADLERKAFSKLRRVLPDVKVQYLSATSIGLFEQTAEHYGEIWYDLNGRKTMSRVTSEEGVLEAIFSLADIKATERDEPVFSGHPLATAPKGAAIIFYLIWPTLFSAFGLLIVRRSR